MISSNGGGTRTQGKDAPAVQIIHNTLNQIILDIFGILFP